jgi:L-serine dehydratase
MGFLNRPLTESSFFEALRLAEDSGVDLQFEVRPLQKPDHPNTVEFELEDEDGKQLYLVGRSIGGGEVEIVQVNRWPVLMDGSAFEVLVDTSPGDGTRVLQILTSDEGALGEAKVLEFDGRDAVLLRRSQPLTAEARSTLTSSGTDTRIYESAPVYFVPSGRPTFDSAAEIVDRSQQGPLSLGQVAADYESSLLDLPIDEILAEMLRRYDVMLESVELGLSPEFDGMQLLEPTAGAIFRAEASHRLSSRSLHTRAAARSMAVMHVDGAMGVVCAAPTGGSAGVLPGALVTLAEEHRLTRQKIALALLAAGALGVVVAKRATFAAEVAGCQVEIGAAGAMAAAAVVDAVGGSAQQAVDAAAIAFQNTMGLVCDPVKGMVEIPCHTRNAVAAANAFICADLVLGGYQNPIPLDETIDAVYAVGKAMPRELLCTAEGGLAATPSARGMQIRDCRRCGFQRC